MLKVVFRLVLWHLDGISGLQIYRGLLSMFQRQTYIFSPTYSLNKQSQFQCVQRLLHRRRISWVTYYCGKWEE